MTVSKILNIIRVIFKIGIWNVVRVLRYRLALQLGMLKFKAIGTPREDDIFFAPSSPLVSPRPVSQTVFGWKDITFDGPPNWHCSVLLTDRYVDKSLPWTQALESVPSDIDVKEIWELSRFYWVPHLARDVLNGDATAGATLNAWLRDWEVQNPPYLGINWSCGQEAAIRILHCAQAAIILDEVSCAQAALVRFIANSAARIEPTLHYALGQANNHGSAEAAGLFVAGTWLEALNADPRATHWKELGRHWLENRAKTLIFEDGSSNQYSTNYHRVVLNTYCFAEVWRRRFNEPSFSAELRLRLRKSNRWLYQMTDKATGVAPDFGANDGSLLLSGGSEDYRDFRPSVQLGAALFDGSRAYDDNQFDELLLLYGIETKRKEILEQSSEIFENGGYILLRNKAASAIMRYPKYEFRPSHSDSLHLDFHVNGEPILFDGGTYSYSNYDSIELSGVSSHNTVEFDGHDQMTKISRFLYGDWLKPAMVRGPEYIGDAQRSYAGYKDSYGCKHVREICLRDDFLTVKDKISGFKSTAILRFRFVCSDYIFEKNKLYFNGIIIEIFDEKNIKSTRVIHSFYCKNYLKIEKCLVLEIEIIKPGEIVTEIKFGPNIDKAL